MKEVNNKSPLQIISLCIGFLGIQIGFALQAGNITRILQNYGADLNQVSLFWLLAPLTGMLVQPIIGYISDKWINSGKTRIPFLLAGGVLSAITLLALPNADLFVMLISPLLFGGLFILLSDMAFNISMHPLRATITDYLPPSQQSKGFTTQTFLISIGAIIGSGLPYIMHHYFNISTIASANQIPDNVKWSFYIGGITLLICILINIKGILNVKMTLHPNLENGSSVSRSILNLTDIPSIMWKIGLIQFFSWSAFFLIWVYMTPAIAQHFYNEYNHLPSSTAYAEAANYTGILFAVYHIAASVFSLLLPYLYRKLDLLNTHFIALILGGIGLIWMYISKETNHLIICMSLLGMAWASILATPFILLSKYIDKRKIGLYFGLFNLFITVPQILNGLWSGFIIEKYFDNNAIFAIVLAGISLIIAALLCLFFTKRLAHGRISDY